MYGTLSVALHKDSRDGDEYKHRPKGHFSDGTDKSMIRSLLRSALRKTRNIAQTISLGEAALPTQQCAYVIGDIHGRADLLKELFQRIKHYAAEHPCHHNTLIYLGDYIDRGPQSRDVIDLLLGENAPKFTSIYLMGNHEEFLLRFLQEPEQAATWLDYGGKETLLSYGVSIPLGILHPAKLKDAAEDFRQALPKTHWAFYQNLQDSYELGDYFFSHAGVAPNRPLHRQNNQDLRWIREPFLSYTKPYTKVVVHGHTITDTPEFHTNRIGIDTGAYHSGRLTCLVLEENNRQILQTGPRAGSF